MQLENVEDVYALSPMQEGMLFHTVAASGAGVYVTQVSAVLAGPLDPATLRGAWDRLLQRHTSLRTLFLWDGLDQPVQVVRQEVDLPWEELDWRDLDPRSRDRQLQALLRQDRARGFDPARAPLMRMTLARTGEREWRWVWSFHHLILDGWSTRLLLAELATAYASQQRAAERRAQEDLEPPLRFREFIAWHSTRDRAAEEAFWRRELSGFAEPNRLSFLRPTSSEGVAEMRQATSQLSREATTALRRLATEHRVTLGTLLQGAWAMLVGLYSGDDDVLFGLTVAGRPPELKGIEQAVGLFINTLPLRVSIDPEARLGDWLRALQRKQLELQQWDSSALATAQRASEMPPGESLFDTLLVFENHPAAGAPPGDAGFELADLRFIEQSNYPLALLVVPDERMELILVHDATRLSSPDAALVLGHLEALLDACARQPEALLGELSPATRTELSRTLVEWNRTTREPVPDCGMTRLFDQAARRAPDAPALISGTETVSYRELSRRCGRLAAHLEGLGVGPGTLVGLFAHRSVEAVVGMLAVLEAGGAYIPLDPDYPRAHHEAVFEEADLRAVLLPQALLAALPPTAASRVLLDAEDSWAPPTGDRGQRAAPSTEDLAYVIYTSGSSGTPRGVAVTQRNLVSSTTARLSRYPEGVDRFLSLSSFAFDSSVAGIFWTLCCGGTLVLAAPGEERDVDALAALIRDHRITHTLCLPALYEVLLAETQGDGLDALRCVIVAGEACPPALAATHHRALPAARLFNEYGPTEATVWSTVHEVVEADAAGPLPIGRPIDNTRLYVLDSRRRPVPIGVAGELYLAGAGVARGYLGRERLTAERFLDLELEGLPTERAYRTGDLVRYRGDGELLFLGRTDTQVKVRGHRIETEGIEAVMRRHPEVAEAAVAAGTIRQRGAKLLLAWFSPRDAANGEAGAALDPARLESWLRERVPEFMVPALWLPVDRLPRRPNGKIDYRALPLPSAASHAAEPGPAGRFVAPSTAVEQALAAVWSQLLEVERVGLGDNFYELGGDSILAIQAVSRLRQAGYAVELRDMALHPTLGALAAAARSSAPSERTEPTLAGDVPLLPIQHWFFDQAFSAPHHWNHSRLLAARVELDPALLARALDHCIAHHDMLRARFERDASGDWRQIVAEPEESPGDGTSALSIVDLSSLPQDRRLQERERQIAAAQSGLDLAKGRLFRAVWFPEPRDPAAESHGRLLLAVHHLIIDAASWAALLDDLERATLQLSAGEAISLPARTASYGRWARRQVEAATSPERTRELTHWDSLAAAEVAELPVDFAPDRHPTEADARSVSVELDARRTEALLKEAHEAYGTSAAELLVTALALAFRRWTGSPVLRLGLEGHGRPEALDTSRTVGWFTTSFPVDLELDDGRDPGSSIQAIKEQLRRVPGDGSGYGVLRYLSPDPETRRRLEAGAEPRVLFNYLSRVQAGDDTGLWRSTGEAEATSRDPSNARPVLVEINAAIRRGRLTANWVYCRTVHRRETIEGVAATFIAELEALIEHCLADEAGGMSAADFPQAELGSDQLEQLLDRLGGDT